MRISFGGGRRRGPYGGISFELGPFGSMIVGLIMAVIGAGVVLFSIVFPNIILLIIGLVFLGLGIFNYRSNRRIVGNNKNDED